MPAAVWFLVGGIGLLLVVAVGMLLARPSARAGAEGDVRREAEVPAPPPAVAPRPAPSPQAPAEAPLLGTHLEIQRVTPASTMPDFRDKGTGLAYRFTAGHLTDGDLGTCWQPEAKAGDGRGQQLEVVLPSTAQVSGLALANGFQRVDALGDLFLMNSRLRTVRVVFPDGASEILRFEPLERGLKRFAFSPHACAAFRLEVLEVWPGSRWSHLAVSELQVLGFGGQARQPDGRGRQVLEWVPETVLKSRPE